jgi:hypothetical protein
MVLELLYGKLMLLQVLPTVFPFHQKFLPPDSVYCAVWCPALHGHFMFPCLHVVDNSRTSSVCNTKFCAAECVFHILPLSSDGDELIPHAVVNKVLSFWQDVLMAIDNKLDHSCFMKTTFPSSPAEMANKSQKKKKQTTFSRDCEHTMRMPAFPLQF